MERQWINMHMHTSASDGEYSAIELWNLIQKSQLKTVSITDHDTVAAYNDIKSADDITLINGCEFSATPHTNTYGSRLHILGYDMDLKNKELLKLLSEKREKNQYNLLLQVRFLEKDFGISFPKEEIDAILKKKDLGRPDLAKLLVTHKYAKDIDDAFDRYLVPVFEKSKPFRKGNSSDEIFDVIKKAGGFISIAHMISNRFTKEELKDFLLYCHQQGVDAIELYHPHHTKEYRQYLLSQIKEYSFFISGGTDYHGPHIKPERALENNTNDYLKIKKLSLCDYIKRKKSH